MREYWLPWTATLGSITISTINQWLGAVSIVLTICYTVWKWIKEARRK